MEDPSAKLTMIKWRNQLTILIEDEIFWFDITMQDVLVVHVFESSNQASNEES